jgi:hypothetical protein
MLWNIGPDTTVATFYGRWYRFALPHTSQPFKFGHGKLMRKVSNGREMVVG